MHQNCIIMQFQTSNLTPATVTSRTQVSTDYLTPTCWIGNAPPVPRPTATHPVLSPFQIGQVGPEPPSGHDHQPQIRRQKSPFCDFPRLPFCALSAPFLPSSQHKNEHKIRHSQPLNVTTFSEKQAKCYRYYKSVTRFLVNIHVTLVYFKVIFQSNLHEINLGVGSLPLM